MLGGQSDRPIPQTPVARQGRRSSRLFLTGARTLGRSVLGSVGALARGQSRDQVWQAVGEDWYRTLSEMKGAAMKFGQMVSQYADVLPAPLAEQLQKLQRDAQPIPFAEARGILDEVWGEAQWARLPWIDPQAMACASIGQVHAARLDDERDVVVKIRHRGVTDDIDSDIAMLGRMLKLSRVMPVDAKAIDEVLAEVADRLREETDYRIELANLQALRARNDDPGVRLPEPVIDLCSDRCLVLERVDAASLEEAKTWPQSERDRLGDTLMRWTFDQVFRHGVLHADPHPGNFGFYRDGGIAVYDFGCVKRVAPEMAAQMRDFLRAADRRDWSAIHQLLIELHALRGTAGDRGKTPALADLQALYQRVHEAIYGSLFAEQSYDFSDPAVLERSRALATRSIKHVADFRPVRDMAFVMRTLSGMYWLLRALGARVDLRSIIDRHTA